MPTLWHDFHIIRRFIPYITSCIIAVEQIIRITTK